ncbi:MAG: tetratricopeptide repeat protein [Deltaproteobacteria bacterium]|nr:tetratricopeptide repeat protein [Deltaproteobacteria bacterium]
MRVITTVLRSIGFTKFAKAWTGTEAWEMVQRKPISFVVADWDLEEMSGLALLRVMRTDEKYRKIPFIIMSSRLTKSQVVKAGEAGVNGIIVMPPTIKAFEGQFEHISTMLNDPEVRKADEYLSKADQFLADKQYDKAMIAYRKVLQVYQPAEVYYNIGYIKAAQEKYGEAIVAFRKATEINATYAKAFKGMGLVYQKMGMTDKAHEAMQRAAEIYISQDMVDDAESLLLQVARTNPDSANVYNSLGILYRRQGKYREALAQYRSALKVSPDDENIYFNIGQVFILMKDFDQAKKAFHQALKIHPSFAEAKNMITSLDRGLVV